MGHDYERVQRPGKWQRRLFDCCQHWHLIADNDDDGGWQDGADHATRRDVQLHGRTDVHLTGG